MTYNVVIFSFAYVYIYMYACYACMHACIDACMYVTDVCILTRYGCDDIKTAHFMELIT